MNFRGRALLKPPPKKFGNPADAPNDKRSSVPTLYYDLAGRDHFAAEPTKTGNLPGYGPWDQFIAPGARNIQEAVNTDQYRLASEEFVKIHETSLVVPRRFAEALAHTFDRDINTRQALQRLEINETEGHNFPLITVKDLLQDFPIEPTEDVPATAAQVRPQVTADDTVFKKSFPHGWHTVPAEGEEHQLDAIIQSWKHQYPALSPIEFDDLRQTSVNLGFGSLNRAYTFRELSLIFNDYMHKRTKRNFELRLYDESHKTYYSSRNDSSADCLWLYRESDQKNETHIRALHPLSYREDQMLSKLQIDAFRLLQTTRDQWKKFDSKDAEFPDYEAYFNVRIPGIKSGITGYLQDKADATTYMSKELLVWLADYLRVFEATSHIKDMARRLGGWWDSFKAWASRAAAQVSAAARAAKDELVRQMRRVTYQNVYDSVHRGATWANTNRSSLGWLFGINLFFGYQGGFNDVYAWNRYEWCGALGMEIFLFLLIQFIEGHNSLWHFLGQSAYAIGRFIRDSTYATGRFSRDSTYATGRFLRNAWNGTRDLTYRATVAVILTLCDLRLVLAGIAASSLVSFLVWYFQDELRTACAIAQAASIEAGTEVADFTRFSLYPALIDFLTHPFTLLCLKYGLAGLAPLLCIGTIWYLMRRFHINPFAWTLGVALAPLPRPDINRAVDNVVARAATVQGPWNRFVTSVERNVIALMNGLIRFLVAIKQFFFDLGYWIFELFADTPQAIARVYYGIVNSIVRAFHGVSDFIAYAANSIYAVLRYILITINNMFAAIYRSFLGALLSIGALLSAFPWHYVGYYIAAVSAIAVGVWLALRFGPYSYNGGQVGFIPTLASIVHGLMDFHERRTQERNQEMLQQAMGQMEGMIRGLQPSRPMSWFRW